MSIFLLFSHSSTIAAIFRFEFHVRRGPPSNYLSRILTHQYVVLGPDRLSLSRRCRRRGIGKTAESDVTAPTLESYHPLTFPVSLTSCESRRLTWGKFLASAG